MTRVKQTVSNVPGQESSVKYLLSALVFIVRKHTKWCMHVHNNFI